VWAQFGTEPVWLIAGQAGLLLSVVAGSWLVERLLRTTTLISESAMLLEESDYTTRFRPTGQEEIDRLIDIYNRMVDALRAERVRVREQHHFLQGVLDVSPSGTIILDHDGRVDAANPAAERLLGPAVAPGADPAAVSSALSDVLHALRDEASAVVTLPGARRAKASRGSFMDRGFARTFIVVE